MSIVIRRGEGGVRRQTDRPTSQSYQTKKACLSSISKHVALWDGPECKVGISLVNNEVQNAA